MKIERNGTAIELTPAEIEAAYKEHRFENMKLAVKMRLERCGEPVFASVEEIANEAIRDLGLVDAYWTALDQSVGHTVRRHIDRVSELRCQADFDATDDVIAGNTLALDNCKNDLFNEGYSKAEVQYYVECYHKKRNTLL